jgi:hypothetical protein
MQIGRKKVVGGRKTYQMNKITHKSRLQCFAASLPALTMCRVQKGKEFRCVNDDRGWGEKENKKKLLFPRKISFSSRIFALSVKSKVVAENTFRGFLRQMLTTNFAHFNFYFSSLQEIKRRKQCFSLSTKIIKTSSQI